MRRALLVLAVASVTACSHAVGEDGRAAAIQASLDAHPPEVEVPYRRTCQRFADYMTAVIVKRYSKLPLVKIRPDGEKTSGKPPYVWRYKCWRSEWSPAVRLTASTPGWAHVVLGRRVVEKVGDDQEMMGTKVTPFRARFVPTETGKSILAHGLVSSAEVPHDIPDGHAVLAKNADGKLVVQ